MPDFMLASLATGDAPAMGGQIVFAHKLNVRSNIPKGEGVTCSCHIFIKSVTETDEARQRNEWSHLEPTDWLDRCCVTKTQHAHKFGR